MPMPSRFRCALLSLLISAPILFASPAVGQTTPNPDVPIKIAVIAFSQDVLATRQGQQMVKEIQTQFMPLQTKLHGESDELDALKKQLQTGNWTDAERASRQATIDEKQKAMNQEAEDAQKAYNDAMQTAYQPIAQAVSKAAEDYSQRNGFTVVLDMSDSDTTVLWALPSTNISAAVVAAFDAGHGGAAASGAVPAPQAIPARIALINFQQAVLDTDEGKQLFAALQAKYEPRRVDLEAQAAEIDRLKKALQAAPATLPGAERASRQRTIDEKQAQETKDATDAQEAFSAEMQDLFQQIAEKVFATLQDNLTHGGYTILFDKPGTKLNVLWAAPGVQVDAINSAGGTRVDLSKFAVEAYNVSHPVPVAAPTAPAVAQAQTAPARPTTQARALVPEAMPAAAPAGGGGAVPSVPGLENGTYYALVIGINHYPQGIPTLATAVADANSVGDELQRRYGFVVQRLLDKQATRASILTQINWYRDHLKPEDNLLIYYAGHGYSDRDADRAYWLPVDADSAFSPNRISADDLATEVRVQAARHVLIISDSCYSGDLSRDLGMIPSPSDQAIYLRYLGKMLKSRSRTIMASGGDEPVADNGTDGHSVFAYALLQGLEEADENMFTASDLFAQHLRQRVGGASDQQPRYDVIRNSNHEEGDFVFMKNGVPSANP